MSSMSFGRALIFYWIWRPWYSPLAKKRWQELCISGLLIYVQKTGRKLSFPLNFDDRFIACWSLDFTLGWTLSFSTEMKIMLKVFMKWERFYESWQLQPCAIVENFVNDKFIATMKYRYHFVPKILNECGRIFAIFVQIFK